MSIPFIYRLFEGEYPAPSDLTSLPGWEDAIVAKINELEEQGHPLATAFHLLCYDQERRHRQSLRGAAAAAAKLAGKPVSEERYQKLLDTVRTSADRRRGKPLSDKHRESLRKGWVKRKRREAKEALDRQAQD